MPRRWRGTTRRPAVRLAGPKIRAGENYRGVIVRELDAAKAVVVIWTQHSVKSEWVISHATRKHRDRYVAVREDGLDEHHIPRGIRRILPAFWPRFLAFLVPVDQRCRISR